MKTVLRYPGGKSRAVKHILPLLPADCKELCSPFLGGGSVELAAAEKGIRVYGYDLFEPLVWFWRALTGNPQKLADITDTYRVHHPDFVIHKKNQDPKPVRGLLKEDFYRLRTELRNDYRFSFENAARFYAINRSSFSGATFSGGWSKLAAYKRFTKSSIERLEEFSEPKLYVAALDFKESIATHPDTFLYLDPPYMLKQGRDNLYGDDGNTHVDFDHMGLHQILSQRKDWLLSYNDCPAVRELYSKYEIQSAAWAYGMNKSKESSELLIIAR